MNTSSKKRRLNYVEIATHKCSGKGTFTVDATVHSVISEKLYYEACSQCSKKLTDVGTYLQCARCSNQQLEGTKKYCFQIRILDFTADMETTGFAEAGRVLFGTYDPQKAVARTALWKRGVFRLKCGQYTDKAGNLRYSHSVIGVSLRSYT